MRDTTLPLNPNIPKKLTPFLKLPSYVEFKQDPEVEVEFYARAFKRAKNITQQAKAINGLRLNAARWDLITRSCIYYPYFEKLVGYQFPGFWKD